MLTPTDVHYLVGLLTMSAEPDGVEIELGSMVTDTAAQEERDVDITVTARNPDRSVFGVGGVEVKAHSRPLDSTHVEQLACKLNDMPSLSHRAIVSASGYYEPAVRKGEKHGVDLLELKEWDQRAKGFDHFKAECVPFVVRRLEWIGEVAVHVNPRVRIAESDRPLLLSNPPIWRADDDRIPLAPDFLTFVRRLQQQAANQLMKQWEPAVVSPNDVKRARVAVQVADAPFVRAGDRRIIVKELVYEGGVRWREELGETKYKVLQRIGDARPLAGCCVFEVPGWGLCGLMVSNADRDIRFVHVPVMERNRRKIFRRPLIDRTGQVTPII